MESRVAQAIGLQYQPVAVLLADQKPDQARSFKEGKWGCVMFLLAAAVKGETAAFDRNTFGCPGGGTGLGFGNQYPTFAGGEECFKYFLSSGNENWERGRQVGEEVKPFMRPESHHHFMHGERYLKNPELVGRFLESLPMTDVPTKYVLFKPLKRVQEADGNPATVIFLGDQDQIAALTVLANYGRGHNENVIFPFAAGCQSIGIYPFREAQRQQPRAVLGLNDISARLYLGRMLKGQVLSFAAPFALYREMEENLSGSFLEGNTWRELTALRRAEAPE
jgi:uncharacterized protein (DUF169 family)